jgi:hypothetical protein
MSLSLAQSARSALRRVVAARGSHAAATHTLAQGTETTAPPRRTLLRLDGQFQELEEDTQSLQAESAGNCSVKIGDRQATQVLLRESDEALQATQVLLRESNEALQATQVLVREAGQAIAELMADKAHRLALTNAHDAMYLMAFYVAGKEWGTFSSRVSEIAHGDLDEATTKAQLDTLRNQYGVPDDIMRHMPVLVELKDEDHELLSRSKTVEAQAEFFAMCAQRGTFATLEPEHCLALDAVVSFLGTQELKRVK